MFLILQIFFCVQMATNESSNQLVVKVNLLNDSLEFNVNSNSCHLPAIAILTNHIFDSN